MAIRTGVIGRINQSMDGITFSNWKGKNVMKRQVPANNSSNTPAQMMQRSKFGALAVLAGLFGSALRTGFRMAATDKTEQNVFTSVNKDAVSYSGGIAVVDYSMLKLSSGTVAPGVGFKIQYNSTTGVVTGTWDDNSNGGDALPTDVATVVLVDVLSNQTFVQQPCGTRQDNYDTTAAVFPTGLTPANIRGYLFFKRANSTATSSTVTDTGEV